MNEGRRKFLSNFLLFMLSIGFLYLLSKSLRQRLYERIIKRIPELISDVP